MTADVSVFSPCSPEGHGYLGGEQRVGVEVLHAADQFVPGVHHVIHEGAAEQEPIRAPVHGDALWDLPVSQAPHVGVALQEESVQTLFPDEAASGAGEHESV